MDPSDSASPLTEARAMLTYLRRNPSETPESILELIGVSNGQAEYLRERLPEAERHILFRELGPSRVSAAAAD